MSVAIRGQRLVTVKVFAKRRIVTRHEFRSNRVVCIYKHLHAANPRRIDIAVALVEVHVVNGCKSARVERKRRRPLDTVRIDDKAQNSAIGTCLEDILDGHGMISALTRESDCSLVAFNRRRTRRGKRVVVRSKSARIHAVHDCVFKLEYVIGHQVLKNERIARETERAEHNIERRNAFCPRSVLRSGDSLLSSVRFENI